MRTILRYLLLRVLPERLVPFLLLWDVYKLVRRHMPGASASDEDDRRPRSVGPDGRVRRRRKPLW